MSDEIKFEDPIHKVLDAKALKAQRKEDVQEKELLVRERKADSAISKIEQNDKDAEIAKNTNYGAMSIEEVKAMQQDNIDYMLAARAKIQFINEAFDDAVPFFRKNIILIGGKTGEGKSTTVANIILATLMGKLKGDQKKKRVLVLTNEEKREDVFNRVTCLIKGWHYTNHDKFSDEQLALFGKYMEFLSKDGMLTVIDDTYNGASGTTTTLEGICQVFDNLMASGENYDAVLYDYYQNCKESRNNPGMNEWEVQAMLARRLDQYKNTYPAPIVVMAQVQQPDPERQIPFKTRIEGRKVILNVATCCLEMVANRTELTTEWIIHKSRFNEAVGEHITTGYNKGRYVVYDEPFRNIVAEIKAKRETENYDKACGMTAPKAEEVVETPEVKKEGTNNE